MEAQIKEDILESIPKEPSGQIVHYVPHQPVIREDAESTKMRIVYDCSARSSPEDPSLNDCLEKGPPLQPLILDILLRNRILPLCITGDIKKAFLQIKLDPADRDAQRLLWYNNMKDRKMAAYGFTRVIFGSASSPHILGATLEKHLSQYKEKFPETVEALLRNAYVDDVQFGGYQGGDLLKFKAEATQILHEGGFELQKWHSNVPEAKVPTPETSVSVAVEEDATTYAKTEVGTKSFETKILGIPWNKKSDELTISLSRCADTGNEGVLTKRKMLSVINGVLDPLGLASSVITLNILIRGKPAQMLEEDLNKIGDDKTLPKRMVFLAKSKEQLRKRWLREYLYELEERKHKQNGSDTEIPKIGKVVLLKEDIKNRAQWRIGRVVGKVIGRYGVIRGLKIKLGNGYIVERPLQLTCDLEVGGENCAVNVKLNPKAQELKPRERLPRKARDDAKNKMAVVKIYEDLEVGY